MQQVLHHQILVAASRLQPAARQHSTSCALTSVQPGTIALQLRPCLSGARLLSTSQPRRTVAHPAAAAIPVAVAAAEPAAKPTLATVQTEEQLFGLLKGAVSKGAAPQEVVPYFLEFYKNYKKAVLASGIQGYDEKLVVQVAASVADRCLKEFVDPYTFPSYHHRILEPYNYYEFGQRYTSTLIDFKRSWVGHLELFDKVAEQLAAGENVVLLANHQTEADPGVWACLLEARHPNLATDIIYVAGDRVVTDALCKPFSMGRNLFCVHSKKRMDDVPELKAQKQATNRKTLSEMTRALAAGGKLLWIAPSGGRDRPNADGVTLPDRFDPAAVELMRTLLAKAKRPGHLYPLAMYSWEIMPPPAHLNKGDTEQRITKHAGCGIALRPPLDVDAILEGVEAKEERQRVLAEAAWREVTEEYKQLSAAIQAPGRSLWSSLFPFLGQQTNKAYVQPWDQAKAEQAHI